MPRCAQWLAPLRVTFLARRAYPQVRILLDAHDRHNAGLADQETFRHAICYAFGNDWTELRGALDLT